MAGQPEHTYQLAEAVAEAGRGWSLEAALSSGRVRAGGRVGVSALGGSPCAQLSLVGHHCTGEECGEVHRRGAGEVQARNRQEACSACSVLAGRKVLTIPHALLADDPQLGGVAGAR